MSFLKQATRTKFIGAIVLGATALTSVSPAMAQGYYGHRSGGDTTGAAIAGGIIGLALGAIVASSISKRNDHDRRYADRGWQYRDGYYWDRQGRRYDRDGRLSEDAAYGRDGRNGYYDRRGYDDRGYGQSDRGYYGRDSYYGNRTNRFGY